jgi:hypothetical protein
VTADLYTHALTAGLIEAIEKMDAMLGHDSGDSYGLPALTFVEPRGFEPLTFCLPVLFDLANVA